MSRTMLTGLLLLALVGSGACSARRASGSRPAAGAQVATSQSVAPMRFRRMTAMLRAAQADRARGDAALLRRRSPALSNEGLALIKATLPHDVSRTDVPRYLEGRARFGEALKVWVGAVSSGSDEQLYRTLDSLDAALRGWVDAYTGVAPETSV